MQNVGLLVVTLLLVGQAALALDPPDIQWERWFMSDTLGTCLEHTADGGYAVAGVSRDGGENHGAYMLKLDSAGAKQWDRVFDWTAYSEAWSGQQTADGGYILAGTTYRTSLDTVVLMKCDSVGNPQWRYSAALWSNSGEVRQTRDGGYINAGDNEIDSIYLMKLGFASNREWIRLFAAKPRDWSNWRCPVRQCTDGGFVAGADALFKTDSSGALCWRMSYDRVWIIMAVIQTSDGGFAATGIGGTQDRRSWCNICLLKTDSLGHLQWKRVFPRGAKSEGRSVVETSDGGYFVTACDSAGMVLRTDSSGTLLWSKVIRDGYLPPTGGQQTEDGGFIVLVGRRLVKLEPELR